MAGNQAPHTVDDDEIRIARSGRQTLRAVDLAGHPQVELVHRRAAGQRQPVRVEKIWPALEHPHPPPLTRVQARQGTGHRGLALAGSRGGDEDGGAVLAK